LGDDQAAQAIFRARSQHANAMRRHLGREGAETEKDNKDYAEQPLHSIYLRLQPTSGDGGIARSTISHAKWV
jgi:hypothetical protein